MEQQTGEDIMELSFSFDMSEFVKEGLFKEKKEIFLLFLMLIFQH